MHVKNIIYETVRSGYSSSLPTSFRCKGETDSARETLVSTNETARSQEH
jgi:hypothetical protein